MSKGCCVVLALAVLVAATTARAEILPDECCRGCIYNTISSCGPLRISRAYWADAGKPTVNTEAPESATAYDNCSRDTYCTAKAVQGYMTKFKQDCTGDDRTDCEDFEAIYKLGGYRCKGDVITGTYAQQWYQQCKATVGVQRR